MILISFKHTYTAYMATEDSHVEVKERTISIVVPEATDLWRVVALTWCGEYAGNCRDDAFEMLSVTETKVDAIMEIRTR